MLNAQFQALVLGKLHWSLWVATWEPSLGQSGDVNPTQSALCPVCSTGLPEAVSFYLEHGEFSPVRSHEHEEWHLFGF